MRRSFVYAAALVVFLVAAYATKPSDKKCIIEGVSLVWGSNVPSQEQSRYYEAFMNVTSKAIVIDDLVFFKRIQYKYKSGNKTVAFGAFNRVFSF